MIGPTRSRVSLFMNEFSKVGFMHYDGDLLVQTSLLKLVPHD
jgi:CRP/FNR family transcriptional regulator, cyclic AMP receptor protein